MIVGIDPKVDYAFKHLFGRETCKPLLINAINSVIQPSRLAVVDLELLNPFNLKQSLDDKLSILDIKARDQSGRYFNVEMQMLGDPAFLKRILFYSTRLHQQQLAEGEDYALLQPTISIVFLNQIIYPDVPDWLLKFQILEARHHFRMTDDLEFHLLELPKFTKTAEELTSDLDIWLYFLRHAEKMDLAALPTAMKRPLMRKALEELNLLTQDELERARYEDRWKARMDESSRQAQLRREDEARRKDEEARRQDEEARQRDEEARQRDEEARRQDEEARRQDEEARRQDEEARRKFEEERRAFAMAKEKVLEEGRREGKIELVQSLERLLKRAITPTEQLMAMSLDDMSRLAQSLEQSVRSSS